MKVLQEQEDLWDHEVGLLNQSRIDAESFVSSQSLKLREVARGIVIKYGGRKGCAIIVGSVAWGYAKEGSDVDINYYPYKNGLIGNLAGKMGGFAEINLQHKFHNRFTKKGYDSEPVGFYYSMIDLKKHLKNAKNGGVVDTVLVNVVRLAKSGIIIGNGLTDLVSQFDEMKKDLNVEQINDAGMDRFFKFFTPIKSSVNKYVKRLEEQSQTIPESVISLREYLKKY